MVHAAATQEAAVKPKPVGALPVEKSIPRREIAYRGVMKYCIPRRDEVLHTEER
jgi:hypothetical protein